MFMSENNIFLDKQQLVEYALYVKQINICIGTNKYLDDKIITLVIFK